MPSCTSAKSKHDLSAISARLKGTMQGSEVHATSRRLYRVRWVRGYVANPTSARLIGRTIQKSTNTRYNILKVVFEYVGAMHAASPMIWPPVNNYSSSLASNIDHNDHDDKYNLASQKHLLALPSTRSSARIDRSDVVCSFPTVIFAVSADTR